jgi:hypothetical protein
MSDRQPLGIVSFVIPVRNDAERLVRCLRSILSNRRPDAGVEIVVADNGSTDDSAAAARALGATVIEMPGARLGAMRNAAAKAARGNILAFVDADHEIGAVWVRSAVESMARPDVVAVGAPCRPPAQATWVQRMYDRLRRHDPGSRPVDWLGSGNMAVRRSAFEAVGGFDPSLETCEDVDLCRKLRAQGGLILGDERLQNVHYGDPATLGSVFSGELWRGRDNLRVSLRPPRTWQTLVSAAIPASILAALVVMLVGLASRSTPGRVMAGAALSYVLGLALARSAKMVWRHGRVLSEWPPAFAVACAYDLGRALALTARVGYGSRRQAASR